MKQHMATVLGTILVLGAHSGLVTGCDSTDKGTPQTHDAGGGDTESDTVDSGGMDTNSGMYVPETGALSACAPPNATSGALPDPAFASPYGVIVIDDLVVVTNANLDAAFTPGAGWLSVVDANTLELKNRIRLPHTNAQFLSHDGDVVYVSMSGPSVYDLDSGLFFGTGTGGIAMVHKNNLTTASRVGGTAEFTTPEPGSLAGFPGSLVTIPNQNHLFVGSGTGPYVYVIDTTTCTFAADLELPWLTGPEDGSNHLIYVGRSPDNQLLVTDFNSGTLQWWDSSTGKISGDPIATKIGAEDMFPGPSYPEPHGSDIVLLNAVSQSVVRVSAAEGAQWIADVGSYPNRLAVIGDIAYVTIASPLDSGNSDFLTRIDLVSGEAAPEFARFAPKTNPMAVAWHPPTNRLFVTGNSSNSILVVDGTTGAIQDVLEP